MGPLDALPAFFIAIAAGVVMGIAALGLVYKMIDGDLGVGPGLIALILVALALALAIQPPHPMVPGAVLVSALALLAMFPFAESRLEEMELRAIDANGLRRSLEAVHVRPDNYSAKLEVAKVLYRHCFHAQAIELASATLGSLGTERDELRNQSAREMFSREESLLRRWRAAPADASAVKCPRCGAYNRPSELFCAGCQGPYLLDIVEGQEVRPRVWAKLVIAWAAIALLIPGCVAVAMNLGGILRPIAFVACLAAVGLLIAWLFRPPKFAAQP